MLSARIHVNPSLGEVFYEIEGSTDELSAIDLVYVNKLNKLAKDISSTLDIVERKEQSKLLSVNSSLGKEAKKDEYAISDPPIEIRVPQELIDSIIKLEERIKFPILWYFSSRQSMTVKDFLMTCAKKGFGLSFSWLPSAGGNFKRRLVNEDMLFREADKLGREVVWEFTDLGKLKVMKEIEKLRSAR